MSHASPIQDLLREDRLFPLGPGTPCPGYHATLEALTVDAAFAPHKVVDRDAAQACLAGLWLYFDYLDECHQISQDLDTADGSYWHALMHRREPDFWNSKYWFRRVGRHPVDEALCESATELTIVAGTPQGTELLVGQKTWDPLAFVDLCEAASQRKADEMLCRRIQRCEWDLLFEYCHRKAVE